MCLSPSLAGMGGSSQPSSRERPREETSGLTMAQQQLLAAAGTSLTSVGGKEYGSASRARWKTSRTLINPLLIAFCPYP